MSAEPDTPTACDNDRRLPLFRKLALAVLIAIPTLVILVGVLGKVVSYSDMEAAKADKARLDMKTLETAYKSAVGASKQKQPSYPSDIIPFLEQGSGGLIDPWDKQYQMRLIQTTDGPRPQFFTFAPGGEEIVWPKQ
jgi:hypothetical protein